MTLLSSAVLLGRDQELGTIDSLLDGIGDGGGSMLIRGEAGLGKSALLDEAEARAAGRGIAVLRTAGAPSETQLAFSGLQKLLRPRLEGIDELPARQARALRVAFGLSDGPAPELFLIALAALDLLADTAADSPLLVVVEDAHWLDADTSEVLSFVARRVELEPIVLLFAVREGHETPLDHAQLPEMNLGPLDAPDAASLLDTHAPGLQWKHFRQGRARGTVSGPRQARPRRKKAGVMSTRTVKTSRRPISMRALRMTSPPSDTAP